MLRSAARVARRLPTRTAARAASSVALHPKPIELFYAPTPNGWKVTLLLEEADIPYKVVPVNLQAGDQHQPSFLKLSPNGRMPAIVDPNYANAKPLSIFESGAIMMHLADAPYFQGGRRFLPASGAARSDVLQWLFWVNAGLGPMAGQLSHFNYYAPKLDARADHSYAKRRYTAEYERLIGVMEAQLTSHEYLAIDGYTIADMAAWPWVKPWRRWMGAGLDKSYPHVFRWYEAIKAREATSKGLAVLREEAIKAQRAREATSGLSEEAKEQMFGFKKPRAEDVAEGK
jgi:GST-like protein